MGLAFFVVVFFWFSRGFQMLPDGSVDDAVTDARLQKVDLGGAWAIIYIYTHHFTIWIHAPISHCLLGCLVAWWSSQSNRGALAVRLPRLLRACPNWTEWSLGDIHHRWWEVEDRKRIRKHTLTQFSPSTYEKRPETVQITSESFNSNRKSIWTSDFKKEQSVLSQIPWTRSLL